MKKITFLLVAVLVLCFVIPNTFAQNVKGVLAGINMANVSGDDADALTDPSNLMGIAGGLFMVKPLNDNMGFRAELLYSQNGVLYDDIDPIISQMVFGGAVEEMKMKITYLAVPLLLQYGIGTEGSIQPIILAGPYVAFKLSATQEADGEEDDLEDVKSMDYGVVLGGGIVINNKFEITARYIMGLNDIPDEDADVEIKNKTIQILAGIRL